MRVFRSVCRCALASAVVFLPVLASAQGRPPDGALSGNIKYNAGQSMQPIFEGWTKAADGSFQLWFGYLNRNHVEDLSIPVGAENSIEPGGPDRNQPTYFYPRFNRQLFFVSVPKDFGQKEVVWTVVAHGQTERAVGWLRPDWEIASPASGLGTGRSDEDPNNKPPTLSLAGPGQVALPGMASLKVTVTDDGLPPKKDSSRAPNRDRPPAFDFPEFKGAPPVNVPQVEKPTAPKADGRLVVTWIVWRGPAPVVFSPAAASADSGVVDESARFSVPGEYVLRAKVTDGAAYSVQDVKIVVRR